MELMSIGDLSRRSGVTVRALRYYESKGLISPQRTESRQRVYAYRDIVRLQQIQMLKRTGFTIAQISDMLGQSMLDARAILLVQKDMLEKQHRRLESSIALIADALKTLDSGSDADLSTLCNIIRMGDNAMSEEKWQKVWDKFYTPEEQARWKAAKQAVPAAVVEENQRRWPDLIARTETLVAKGENPASNAARDIAAEWREMSRPLMEADPTLAKSAAKLYDNLDHWPEDGPQAPFSKEVWQFIQAAEAAAKKAS